MAANISFKSLNKEDDAYRSCTIKQGTSFSLAIAPKDANGLAINITGWNLHGAFKTVYDKALSSHYDATTSVLTFTSAAGGTVQVDTVNNRFLVPFTSALTRAITFKGDWLEGVYEFDVTSPDGTVIRPLYGPFFLLKEVSV